MDASEPDFDPVVQIGVHSERVGEEFRYVYTVSNRSRDTLTVVQVGYDVQAEVCELTGARPHAPPDTAYSPPGWDCAPVQAEDPTTFTVGWKLTADMMERGGIPPDTVVSGFTVVLPGPDSLYERCHWLIRFRGPMSKMAYAGELRPDADLDLINPGLGRITGRVTDAQGRGIPYPSIFVKRGMLEGVSKSDGTYSITNVPAGRRTLVARTKGYNPCEKGHVRVAANATTRVDLRLMDWRSEATAGAPDPGGSRRAAAEAHSSTEVPAPCAPYFPALSRVALPFPGRDVDTVGAVFLDQNQSAPPRAPGDPSSPRVYISSLTNGRISLAYRGLGQDTVAKAFTATVYRAFRNADEERLIRIAEETYPSLEAVLAAGETRPGSPPARDQERPWWFGQFDGVRLPYAVTLDAVRYYLALTQALGRGDSTATSGIRMKRSSFTYHASISPIPTTISRDGRVYRDVFVVDLRLSWSDYCGPLCACGFSLDRSVVLRSDGTILCVFGDRKPTIVVS